jgi:hypothetical protein
MELSNSLLRRFWFETANKLGCAGIGVTAYSREDAERLIQAEETLKHYELVSVIDDVDIRSLDQNHIVPNIGPVNFRGIWYPNLFQ